MIIMNNEKTYHLTSIEDPTDEQLQSVMNRVGERARESSRKAQVELDRRMDDVRQFAHELYGH